MVQSVDASALIGRVLRGSHVSSPYWFDTFISIVNLTQFRLSLLFCQLKKLKTTIWVICRAHYLVYSRSLFIWLYALRQLLICSFIYLCCTFWKTYVYLGHVAKCILFFLEVVRSWICVLWDWKRRDLVIMRFLTCQ